MNDIQKYKEVGDAIVEKVGEIKTGFQEKIASLTDRLVDLEQSGISAHGLLSDASRFPRYSLDKVFKHICDPTNHKLDGFEAEQHQELQKAVDVPMNGAIRIPLGNLEKKDIDYGAQSPTAAGSSLVQLYTRELIDVLRERSVVMSIGPRTLNLSGDVDLPRKTADSTAYWITGEGEALTQSTPTFERVELRPKFVGGWAKFTLKMATQAQGIGDIVAEDLMGMIGEEVDRVAIQGSGASNQPTGITNTSGVNVDTWTASPALPTWDDILETEKLLADDKALNGNLQFVTDPTTLKTLKSTLRTASVSGYLAENGSCNGYPIQGTTNCPSNTLIFANWSELVVGTWGQIAVASDPYTDFSSGTVGVRAIMALDINVRHANSFCVSTKS